MINRTSPESALDKQDAVEVKNYTRTPNMLIFGYHDELSPQEKWLYVCLKHLCGKKGTRHLSLRYISEQTGISTGALSSSKNKKGEINQGMIRHLVDAGLIHAEIKKHQGKGNPQYHITITDVWALNQAFFSQTRSDFGQDEEEEYERPMKPVRISDEPVQISDKLVQISDEPVQVLVQYQDYIQERDKITEQDTSLSIVASATNADDVAEVTFSERDEKQCNTSEQGSVTDASYRQLGYKETDTPHPLLQAHEELLEVVNEGLQTVKTASGKLVAIRSTGSPTAIGTSQTSTVPAMQSTPPLFPENAALPTSTASESVYPPLDRAQRAGKRKRSKDTLQVPLKTPEEETFDARCLILYAKFTEWRGYEWAAKGEIINERKYIRVLAGKYSDEQIEQMYSHLFNADYKWSKPSYKFKIGAYVVYSEAPSVIQQMKEQQRNRTGKGSRLSPIHGIDVSTGVDNDTVARSAFDVYVGNGPEERAALHAQVEALRAQGLISMEELN